MSVFTAENCFSFLHPLIFPNQRQPSSFYSPSPLFPINVLAVAQQVARSKPTLPISTELGACSTRLSWRRWLFMAGRSSFMLTTRLIWRRSNHQCHHFTAFFSPSARLSDDQLHLSPLLPSLSFPSGGAMPPPLPPCPSLADRQTDCEDGVSVDSLAVTHVQSRFYSRIKIHRAERPNSSSVKDKAIIENI